MDQLSGILCSTAIAESHTSTKPRLLKAAIKGCAFFSISLLLSACGGDINLVKNSPYPENPAITFEDALENRQFCKETEWSTFKNKQGKTIVNYKCHMKNVEDYYDYALQERKQAIKKAYEESASPNGLVTALTELKSQQANITELLNTPAEERFMAAETRLDDNIKWRINYNDQMSDLKYFDNLIDRNLKEIEHYEQAIADSPSQDEMQALNQKITTLNQNIERIHQDFLKKQQNKKGFSLATNAPEEIALQKEIIDIKKRQEKYLEPKAIQSLNKESATLQAEITKLTEDKNKKQLQLGESLASPLEEELHRKETDITKVESELAEREAKAKIVMDEQLALADQQMAFTPTSAYEIMAWSVDGDTVTFEKMGLSTTSLQENDKTIFYRAVAFPSNESVVDFKTYILELKTLRIISTHPEDGDFELKS